MRPGTCRWRMVTLSIPLHLFLLLVLLRRILPRVLLVRPFLVPYLSLQAVGEKFLAKKQGTREQINPTHTYAGRNAKQWRQAEW